MANFPFVGYWLVLATVNRITNFEWSGLKYMYIRPFWQTDPRTESGTARATDPRTEPGTAGATDPRTEPWTAGATDTRTESGTAGATDTRTEPWTAGATDPRKDAHVSCSKQHCTTRPVVMGGGG